MSGDWVASYDAQAKNEGLSIPENLPQKLDSLNISEGSNMPSLSGNILGRTTKPSGSFVNPPQHSFGATTTTGPRTNIGAAPFAAGFPPGNSQLRGGHVATRGRGFGFAPQPNPAFAQPFQPNFNAPRGRGGFQANVSPRPPHTPPTMYKYVEKNSTPPKNDSHEKAMAPAEIALLNKFLHREVKMMSESEVDVQRQDPTSPLYSVNSFRDLRLKDEVVKALDMLGFEFPTRIQETALPLLLMEPPHNLIAQAQSGTGKTAAFVLTMLCRIDLSLKHPQCICLAPTLELAKQLGEVVSKMGQYMTDLNIHYAIKGSPRSTEKLTEQIVIGTPGKTLEYLQKTQRIDPSKIRCLVLDEADVMISQQGHSDISTVIYTIIEEASPSVQSMLFSATYDSPVVDFATKLVKNAIVVMLKKEEQALPNIKQCYVECNDKAAKYEAIVNLYSGLTIASSVIFCHTKASAMWLANNMKQRGHEVDVLHGEMEVQDRANTIIRFKAGEFRVLITTNVFARGIDVAQVSVVINYDLPIKYDAEGNELRIDGQLQPDCETYLHRIGRTGRFGKAGIAINFIDSPEALRMIEIIKQHFSMQIKKIDPGNLDDLEDIERS
ncbi:unnamed protein product [Caenorhabditis auriculariae]|uniref:RNA helicase n=1 Tax=Caenorhabditis auriculariae TaxID=2777116 RepID=A0A8S1HSS3_9PELO|nr:unnamed protein product [Caenorhabditis auriculariae]